MGVLSDLLSNSKSQLKYLHSLSNSRFIRQISSLPAVDNSSSKARQSPHAPTLVGDLKSNNKKPMLLIEHFDDGSGNYNRVTCSDRSTCFPPYSYSVISAEKSWTDHHKLCNTPFSGYGDYYLGDSCNELVLFIFQKKGDRIGLWNPTTNKIKILPQTHVPARPDPTYTSTLAHGFGFDPVSEDYKVLRFIVFGYKDGSDTFLDGDGAHVELYSLKTNSWKKITPPRDGVPIEDLSVHVNGVFYWANFGHSPPKVLSFDFANEKFSYFPLPPQFHDFDLRLWKQLLLDGNVLDPNFVLVELDGSLAALVHSELRNTEDPFSFEILVWNGESWLKKMSRISIDIPGGVAKVIGLFQNDKLFLLGFKNGELMLFDLAKRKLENLGIHANPNYVGIFPYVFVPHKKMN